jgi:UDP-N-acetylglucosamine 4-epimerase
MRVLVTGGAGFIGSHICHDLIKQGHSVICIDNLSSGKVDNIRDIFHHPNFKFIHLDVLELTDGSPELNVDAICHQAATGSVPKSIVNPELYHKNNVDMFYHILELARIKGIKRFVYASSSSVYGDDTNLPKCESTIGNVLSPYAATKRINEVYAKLYNQCYGIETIGLRYFNVFGPKQNPNGDYAAVIPKFITLLINNMSPKINGDGNASRDFTYVDNVVYANILALTIDNFKCYGEEFNIGDGGCTSVLDLFYSIRDMLQSSVSPTYAPYRSGDILMSNANISKATDLLGYTPSVDLITGLEHTIKYFYEKDNTLQSR